MPFPYCEELAQVSLFTESLNAKCRLQIEKCKMDFAFCALQFAFCTLPCTDSAESLGRFGRRLPGKNFRMGDLRQDFQTVH